MCVNISFTMRKIEKPQFNYIELSFHISSSFGSFVECVCSVSVWAEVCVFVSMYAYV